MYATARTREWDIDFGSKGNLNVLIKFEVAVVIKFMNEDFMITRLQNFKFTKSLDKN